MYKKTVAFCACIAFFVSAFAVGYYFKQKTNIVEINCVIPIMSEEELILNSDLVIEGTVCDIGKSKWSNPELEDGKRNILQTDITVSIYDIVSGEYSLDKVVVRVNKGYDEESNTKMISDAYPDFEVGEEILLFLTKDDSELATEENYFVLTGMRQGKYEISKASTQKAKKYKGNDSNVSIKELKEKIEKVKKDNPDYKEMKKQKSEEIKENNEKLFGK